MSEDQSVSGGPQRPEGTAPVDDYIVRLARRLRWHGIRRRRRLLAEARDHLTATAKAAIDEGMDQPSAEQAAVDRFGSVEQVVAAIGPPRLLRHPLPMVAGIAVALTLLAGTIYAFGQQGLRQEANDPQTAIAHDVARRLSAGEPAQSVAGGPAVDLAGDPREHVSVFDASGRPLASTARLDGSQPLPPAGVLARAHQHGRNSVTWQPRDGVRVAAVAVRWNGGTVLVGRSMRSVERDEQVLLRDVFVGWLVGFVIIAIATLGWSRWRRPEAASGAPVPVPVD